jgi:bifunctional non-homologous end joining protein LigD
MTNRETELKALMLASLDGDAASHRALLDGLSGLLRGYYKVRLARIGRGPTEAEDLVQEAVLAIHFKRHTYDPGEPLTPWVHAIARYKLIDFLRRTLDGEVVVIHEGRTNFSELQAELAAGKQDRLVYYAFDLLWRDGDLRKLPQVERKQMLSDLLGENDIGLPVIFSEHLPGDGQEMFKHAAKLNFEGIVSKNAQAPYRSDRNEAWLKIKTVQKGKFPVIGFVKDPTGVAALYLGKREGKDLVYMGKVGTGWSRTVSSQIRKQLDTVVSPKSKLTKPIKKPKATWVEPTFFADVEYRDITSEGLLRQSSFKGLKRK